MESEINKEIKKKDQTFVNQIIGGFTLVWEGAKKGGQRGGGGMEGN